jgi:predicted nucleic acid-binding protein
MKIYADTSVFGGVFDEEFSEPSKEFFAEVSRGRFQLIVSAIIQSEVVAAPEVVRQLFERYLPAATIVEVSDKALGLRDAYLDAGILTSRSSNDAMHVALATISECALIVSWNFRHIVHFDKIPKFNAVNALHGYQSIGIFSPSQVIDYDET